MWSHLIQMMRARRAVRAHRYESALSLLEDPLIRDDRRAQELRQQALEGMLERAARRVKTGHFDLAAHDLDRLKRLDPDLAGRDELERELGEIRVLSDERQEHEEGLRRGFERALDEGRLGEAREFLKSLEEHLDKPQYQKLEERLADRRLQASAALRQVREALDRGLDRDARAAMDRARRLCTDSLTFRERLVGLSAKWAKERWDEVQQALTAGRTLDAARALAHWWETDPDSDDLQEARDLLLCVADRLAGEARSLATEGRHDEALQLVCQAPGPLAKVNVLRRLKEKLEHLNLLLEGTDDDPRKRAHGMARLYAETKWSVLEAHLATAREASKKLDEQLKAARDLLSQGKTDDGKDKLEAVLTRWPGCDEAKALLEGLIADERERAEQLKAARNAVREARLLEGQRHLFRLVAGGYGADEARSLMRDIERIRGKVSREIASLGARVDAGGDPDQIMREIARLKSQQADSPELADLEALAMRAKARVERVERIRRALDRREASVCLATLREWVGDGSDGGLDAADKLAFASVGTEIEAALRDELARGDPAFVCELGTGLRTWRQMLGLELDNVLADASARVEKAKGLAHMGLEFVDAKRVDEAADVLEKARAFSPNEPQVLRLAHRLRRVEQQRGELERALELAETDRQGAKQALAGRGPTPRPLGSLVLQVRDKVDRSGDLEGGCLLQVEEAGEYLVFSDDRLRIGNATGRSFPQLPVLAKIKAHHATFVRNISFHGGVKDVVEPANGAVVKVNGGASGNALRHGDRVMLGSVLPVVYMRPSPRSSSALIRIEKGFECRGTSRVLWIKQGGRDGRVFIGRGREVHVRVPHAEPELYLYSPGRGRLCVHFGGAGEIDGAAFTGDRELAPGASVTCGKIKFRVKPL